MTTNLADVANSTFDDVPDSFELEDGEYMFEIVRAGLAENANGKAHIALRLKAVQDLSGRYQDDELVNSYLVNDSLWVHTPGGNKMTKNWFQNIAGVDTDGRTKAELAEAVIGTVVRAATKTNIGNNGRSYVNIDGYLKQ